MTRWAGSLKGCPPRAVIPLHKLHGKKLTGAGETFGIVAEKRLSEKGNEYDVFYYTEKAQRGIVEWLLEV